MKLTSEQKSLLRQNLLLQMESSSPVSLPLMILVQGVHLAGFRLEDDAVGDHLDWLVEHGYVRQQDDEMGSGARRWKLTDEGRAYLQSV